MRTVALQFLCLTLLSLLLSSCGDSIGSPDYNPAIGPFDEDGNYVEAWADNPPKKRRRASRRKNADPEPVKVTKKTEPEKKPTTPTKPQARQSQQTKRKTTSTPKPVTKAKAKPKPKPRPKPKVTKKSKPKPKPVKVTPRIKRHKVKKGDTLFGLARRYGTSVSKIRKANNLKGSTIHTGRTLIIPQ